MVIDGIAEHLDGHAFAPPGGGEVNLTHPAPAEALHQRVRTDPPQTSTHRWHHGSGLPYADPGSHAATRRLHTSYTATGLGAAASSRTDRSWRPNSRWSMLSR